jgi:hypothetical protein
MANGVPSMVSVPIITRGGNNQEDSFIDITSRLTNQNNPNTHSRINHAIDETNIWMQQALDEANSWMQDSKSNGLSENEIKNFIVSKTDKDICMTCAICMETLKKDENIVTLKCMHQFHEDIFDWLKKNRNCPICRMDQR